MSIEHLIISPIIVPEVTEGMTARMLTGELKPGEVLSLLHPLESDNSQKQIALEFLGENPEKVWPVIHELEIAKSGEAAMTLDETPNGYYASVIFSNEDGVHKSSVVYEEDMGDAYAQAGLTLLHHVYNVPRPLSAEHQYAQARLKKVVKNNFPESKIVFDFSDERGLLTPLAQGTTRLQTSDGEFSSHPMRERNKTVLAKVTAVDLLRKIDDISQKQEPMLQRGKNRKGKQMVPPRR